MSEPEKIKAAPKKAAREVLFFELEYVATQGRQAMYDAVKQVMKSKDMDVTPALFSRCGLTPRPAPAIQALIEDSGRNLTTGDQLSEQAETLMKTFFEKEATLLSKDLPALIQAAQAKNIEVVALSAWPKNVASALMAKLGLDKLDVDLVALNTTDPIFPRADHWLRLLKDRDQDMIPVIAIVSSHAACKGSLTAGATCVAIPDPYTTFEDFAGAKLVLDSLGDMKAEELLDMVSRH